MKSNSANIKHFFANELQRCCAIKYKSAPSNSQIAKDIYCSSAYKTNVTRETVRKWFKGEVFPDLENLVLLIDFFEMDMANVFPSGVGGPGEQLKEKHLESLDIDFVKKITPLQIELMVDLLSSIKKKQSSAQRS
jgi:hypothetical protein